MNSCLRGVMAAKAASLSLVTEVLLEHVVVNFGVLSGVTRTTGEERGILVNMVRTYYWDKQ